VSGGRKQCAPPLQVHLRAQFNGRSGAQAIRGGLRGEGETFSSEGKILQAGDYPVERGLVPIGIPLGPGLFASFPSNPLLPLLRLSSIPLGWSYTIRAPHPRREALSSLSFRMVWPAPTTLVPSAAMRNGTRPLVPIGRHPLVGLATDRAPFPQWVPPDGCLPMDASRLSVVRSETLLAGQFPTCFSARSHRYSWPAIGFRAARALCADGFAGGALARGSNGSPERWAHSLLREPIRTNGPIGPHPAALGANTGSSPQGAQWYPLETEAISSEAGNAYNVCTFVCLGRRRFTTIFPRPGRAHGIRVGREEAKGQP
jgi:hypothetical protein